MKKIKTNLTKELWKDTTKEKRIWKRKCNNCGIDREFSTAQGYLRSINTLCKSCSNNRNSNKRITRIIDGLKECFKCKKKLPVSEFHLYMTGDKKGKYHSLCNKCKKETFKKYQKTIGRFKRHGITKEIYDKMCKLQSGRCYICNINTTELHIDHNHTTGNIRKLLCRDCNMALGLLKENIITLKNMVKYLENEVYESRGKASIGDNNISQIQ